MTFIKYNPNRLNATSISISIIVIVIGNRLFRVCNFTILTGDGGWGKMNQQN